MKGNEKFDILIAGFGGQGVLLMGDILAWAGMMEGYSTSFLPSYGVEMRGGTVNCIVVITRGELYSPILGSFTYLVAMNPPSLEKYLWSLREGGTLFFNSSLIREDELKREINHSKIIGVPANEIAKNIELHTINMVMLGCIVETTKIVKKSAILHALNEYFKGKEDIIEINKKGIEAGINFIKRVR